MMIVYKDMLSHVQFSASNEKFTLNKNFETRTRHILDGNYETLAIVRPECAIFVI